MNALNHLLDLLSRGKTYTPQALARELEISQGLVEQMLIDLERAGYLRGIDACKAVGCTACSHHGASRRPSACRVWIAAGDRGARRGL
jgi:hypothetical protein